MLFMIGFGGDSCEMWGTSHKLLKDKIPEVALISTKQKYKPKGLK